MITNYTLSDDVSIGTYYIYGRGLEKADQARTTHFFSLRPALKQIHLSEGLYFNWNSELYYLYLDKRDGVFVAHTLTLAHQDFPLSVSTTMNKSITSDIETEDFDWNVSLTYSFTNQLVRKPR